MINLRYLFEIIYLIHYTNYKFKKLVCYVFYIYIEDLHIYVSIILFIYLTSKIIFYNYEMFDLEMLCLHTMVYIYENNSC